MKSELSELFGVLLRSRRFWTLVLLPITSIGGGWIYVTVLGLSSVTSENWITVFSIPFFGACSFGYLLDVRRKVAPKEGLVSWALALLPSFILGIALATTTAASLISYFLWESEEGYALTNPPGFSTVALWCLAGFVLARIGSKMLWAPKGSRNIIREFPSLVRDLISFRREDDHSFTTVVNYAPTGESFDQEFEFRRPFFLWWPKKSWCGVTAGEYNSGMKTGIIQVWLDDNSAATVTKKFVVPALFTEAADQVLATRDGKMTIETKTLILVAEVLSMRRNKEATHFEDLVLRLTVTRKE